MCWTPSSPWACTREGETRQQDADFVRALQGWTAGVAGALTPTAGLLFAFLCRLEPDDRRQDILEANWKDFLTRLGEGHAVAAAALAEPEQGLPAALAGLEAAGLVGVERPAIDPEQIEKLKAMLADHAELGSLDPAALQGLLDASAARATTYTIHPGVAETVRAAADPAVLAAADVELGNYHIAMVQQGLKTEMEGGGSGVAESAAAPRPTCCARRRWEEASTLLERMIQRDESPDSLAFALPLLRRIVEATAGTERELSDAGILARTLSRAGRTAEAEPMLRDADRARRRPGQLPGGVGRRRRSVQPAPKQRPPGGGAESGRGEGRLHAAGRAGAVDATGRRDQTPAGAGRHGPL